MNSIKITNTQKLRILFMCKKLFPEYNNIRFGTSVITTSKDYLYFHKIKNEMQVEIINIHWFEFCMTYLSEKIYFELGYDVGDISDFRKDILDNHPVNYLYEEFLKLKL